MVSAAIRVHNVNGESYTTLGLLARASQPWPPSIEIIRQLTEIRYDSVDERSRIPRSAHLHCGDIQRCSPSLD